jgi:hypothetical protein
MNREPARHSIALVLYVALTLLIFAPAVGDPRAGIGPGLGDPLFNLYVMKWGAHQISQGLPDLWNAPFFFPARGTLALSDHLVGPAAAFLLLRKAGLPSLAAFNLLLLATFALGAWTAYWVLRRSGLSWSGALVGGWVFGYSSFRWEEIAHYQMLRMQWIPPVLWCFDRLLASPTPRRALVFLGFYALHVTGGTYLAYLVHVPLLVLALNRLGAARPRGRRAWVVLGTVAGACALLLAFVFGPYLAFETPPRSVDEVRASGMRAMGFLMPSRVSIMFSAVPSWFSAIAAGSLYPGVAALLLAGVALWAGGKRFLRASGTATARRLGLGLGGAGLAMLAAGLALGDRFTARGGDPLGYLGPLLLTLSGATVLWVAVRVSRGGPLLRWRDMPAWPRGLLLCGAVSAPLCLPMVFWGVQQVVPGFDGMRVPARAFAGAALPLAYLVGTGWDQLRRRGASGSIPRIAVPTLALAVAFESLPRYEVLNWASLPDEEAFPAYARCIAETEGVRAYYELPPTRVAEGELVAMYFGSLHWRPLVNGYSGSVPEVTYEIDRACRPVPDRGCLQLLGRLSVTHVVLHWTGLPWHPGRHERPRAARLRPGFEADLRESGGRAVFKDGSTVVYALAAVR